MANGFGITDPNQLVALGQEGTGAAQIFDSSQPTEQLGSLFERLNKEKQQARLNKQKSEQAKLAKLDKIAPVYGGWDADVPWFKKNFDAWKEIAVVDPDSPQAMGAYNDLIAASVMQEDQKKQALDYKDYLVKNKEKLTPEQFDSGTQWLENYRAAGNPIERANIPPPEYYDVEDAEPYDLVKVLQDTKDLKYEFDITKAKGGVKQQSKGVQKKTVDSWIDALKSNKKQWQATLDSTGWSSDAFEDYIRDSAPSFYSEDPDAEGGGFSINIGGGGTMSGKYSVDKITEAATFEQIYPEVAAAFPDFLPADYAQQKVKGNDTDVLVFSELKDNGTHYSQIPYRGKSKFIKPAAIKRVGDSYVVTGFVADEKDSASAALPLSIPISPDDKDAKKAIEVAYFGGQKLEEVFGKGGAQVTAQELIQKYSQ